MGLSRADVEKLLWGVGLVILNSGVVLSLAFANSGYPALVVIGTMLLIWWVALRGINLGSPRFLDAKNRIFFSLSIGTVGAALTSVGIAVKVPGGFLSSSFTFQIGGPICFFLGVAMYVVALAVAKPIPSSMP